MSFVVAATEAVASAAQDLTNIGSTIDAAGAVAGASTRGELAAAADQVSVAVGQMFSEHADAYQGIRAQIADFHQQFVQAISAAGQAYATAEAQNASPLQTGVRDLLG
ncbi:MAG: PE family protein [Mycobacterium sp.]